MREATCKHGSSSRQWRRWLSSALVLASVLVGCGGVAAQELPNTQTQTPTSDWVMLERTRWETLTELVLTLETRLTERVSQGEQLRSQLSRSEQTIGRLETSVETLQTELRETERSRDRLRTSLETERTAWSAERLELEAQRDRARSQRDQEATRAGKLEIRSRRNRLVWQIGIPVAAAAGIVAGAVYENSN